MKDQLFILRPGFFIDGKGPFYCGDSVAVEGLLSFYPQLREVVDVHYIEAPRPREAVVALVGAENQSIPVLVLGAPSGDVLDSLPIKTAAGRSFINEEAAIRLYMSRRYSVGIPA